MMNHIMPTLGLALSSAALIAFVKIVLIDIILSGDNAVVIAMATKSLPTDKRNKAILWGTLGAVILRIILAAVIVYILRVPYVNIVGGLLLLWIAYKVLVGEEEDGNVKASNSLLKAIQTVIIADAVMSLDNVVAIAGAADGNIIVIALGVLVSIPIMIFGSKLIVAAMDKQPWIAYVGSGILAWTASEMILKDEHIETYLHITHGPITYTIQAVLTALVLIVGFVSKRRPSHRSDDKQNNRKSA